MGALDGLPPTATNMCFTCVTLTQANPCLHGNYLQFGCSEVKVSLDPVYST